MCSTHVYAQVYCYTLVIFCYISSIDSAIAAGCHNHRTNIHQLGIQDTAYAEPWGHWACGHVESCIGTSVRARLRGERSCGHLVPGRGGDRQLSHPSNM